LSGATNNPLIGIVFDAASGLHMLKKGSRDKYVVAIVALMPIIAVSVIQNHIDAWTIESCGSQENPPRIMIALLFFIARPVKR
jgi:hypothetical protein